MVAAALTHHQIIELVEPFARRSRHVDLAASDRAARKLVFKTIELPAASGQGQGLRETLSMDCRDERRLVVDRTITHPSGVQATLQAAGPRAAELLAAIETIAPEQHFRAGQGYVVARSYELWFAGSASGDPRSSDLSLFLCRALVQLQGLTLTMTLRMPSLRSVAGDITLAPAAGQRLELPEDLLAVMGWDWARLIPEKTQGWTSKLRLRGNALRRSRTAERALEQAAKFLVEKFAQQPASFHDQHKLARWGVVLRRGIPTLTALFMLAGGLAMVLFADRQTTGPWLAMQYLPIAVLAVGFSLQELPQFEIPPWPRRSRAPHWHELPDAPRA